MYAKRRASKMSVLLKAWKQLNRLSPHQIRVPFLPGSSLLTLADFDSPSNAGKRSSAHLFKQKQILLGEDLGVIIQCYCMGSTTGISYIIRDCIFSASAGPVLDWELRPWNKVCFRKYEVWLRLRCFEWWNIITWYMILHLMSNNLSGRGSCRCWLEHRGRSGDELPLR